MLSAELINRALGPRVACPLDLPRELNAQIEEFIEEPPIEIVITYFFSNGFISVIAAFRGSVTLRVMELDPRKFETFTYPYDNAVKEFHHGLIEWYEAKYKLPTRVLSDRSWLTSEAIVTARNMMENGTLRFDSIELANQLKRLREESDRFWGDLAHAWALLRLASQL